MTETNKPVDEPIFWKPSIVVTGIGRIDLNDDQVRQVCDNFKAKQVADELNRSLYGDGMPCPKIGLVGEFPEYYLGYASNETCRNIKLTWRMWFVMMWQRVKDAWAVLRGKAEIGYD